MTMDSHYTQPEDESLTRPPKGFAPDHLFIEELKRKDFVASVALTEEQVCSPRLKREFTAGCRMMKPLVEFTTKALAGTRAWAQGRAHRSLRP
jgi:uncharacterized protein (DUF2461 family)